jgi:predicted short-subunit dehydrogenase-like oxidoreductase (DUF2520 family)
MQKTVSIIGVGRVGGALALALSNKNYCVKELVLRTNGREIVNLINPMPKILSANELEQLSSDIIFITTQDGEIEKVAQNLLKSIKHKPIIFHTSGSLSSEILQDLHSKGCQVGSFHPLVSISEAKLGSERFKDSFFCLEGDEEAVNVGKKLVTDLQGNAFSIETKYKTLYHASAVMACGHFVALFSNAIEMLTKCGLSAEKSQEILLPLVKSTVENLQTQTPSEALTGTFARGDVEILRKHIQSINENLSPEILNIYLKLGKKSLELSTADKEKIAEMEKEIVLAKNQMLE